jgi:hypothetical protein
VDRGCRDGAGLDPEPAFSSRSSRCGRVIRPACSLLPHVR